MSPNKRRGPGLETEPASKIKPAEAIRSKFTRQRAPVAQGGYWYAQSLMSCTDLPPMTVLVGLVLAAIADNRSGRVQVPLSELARRSHMARRSVVNHLDVLEAQGFVDRQPPETWQAMQRGEATTYTVTIPTGYPIASAPRALGLVQEAATTSARGAHRSIDLKGAAPDADASEPTPSKCPHGHRIARGTCPDPECIEAHERGAAS